MNKINFIIALASGGTGGHISPATAIYDDLKKEGVNPIFYTDYRGSNIITNRDYNIINSGSPSVRGLTKIFNLLKTIIGIIQAIVFLHYNKIKLVIGFGGYASVPTIIAAWILRIPSILHEQNYVLGRANRFCLFFSNILATSFDNEIKFKKNKSLYTGNPVRNSISQIGLKNYNPLKNKRITLLIFGGSQGSRLFSKIIPEALDKFPEKIKNKLLVFHQARKEDINHLIYFYKKRNIEAHIDHYFNNIEKHYDSCDLVISRAGASTVSEISAVSRPSILIPYKNALDDHQTKNAEQLASIGASILLNEASLSSNTLFEKLEDLFNSPNKMKLMAKKAKTIHKPDSSKLIIELAMAKLNGVIK